MSREWKTLPETGFVRVKDILRFVPFSASTWWEGCRTGRFPAPIKLGHRTTVWRAEDIHALMKELGGAGQLPRPVEQPMEGRAAHELCDPGLYKSAAALTGKVLLSEREIVAGGAPWEPICGVYFLVKDMRVVYVGQSEDVSARLSAHRSKIAFDHVSCIQCAKSQLDVLESLYIHTLRPVRNGKANNGGKLAPLGLEKLLSFGKGAEA